MFCFVFRIVYLFWLCNMHPCSSTSRFRNKHWLELTPIGLLFTQRGRLGLIYLTHLPVLSVQLLTDLD